MSLTLIIPPEVEPLSLAEVKSHLRVDHTDDDATIAMYIAAARSYVDGEDGFLGRALVTQTWLLTLDEFPEDEIKIPLPPLQSVVSITYDDPDGNSVAVAPADYYVDVAKEPGWVVPISGADWPTPLEAINAVRIQFVAGYEAPGGSPEDLTANIPPAIKQGMLLLIGEWFDEKRADEILANLDRFPFPRASQLLLRPFRVQLGMA